MALVICISGDWRLKMWIVYGPDIVECDYRVGTISIAQELNIAPKTIWNHLNKAGYKNSSMYIFEPAQTETEAELRVRRILLCFC